jgi:hypothetical protein
MIIVAVVLRLFVGCGLAAPLGASGQLPTPFAAFLAGLAAPLIVARIFQTIPVVEPEETPVPHSANEAINSQTLSNSKDARHPATRDHPGAVLESGISDVTG